ncbi:MAG: CHAT domain-containing protein [Acidobacteria bacterium]|nr:CHAT domain-containing protein [Acidobacteriota bacterium]
MNDRSKRILGTLRLGNREERAALLEQMPPSSLKDEAGQLFVESDYPERRVLALSILVNSYGMGQAAEFGGDLARAAYPFAREIYEKQGSQGPLSLAAVSATASSGLNGLNLIGHYSESVEFADEVIPDLESLGDDANLPDIYAKKIEALIGLHRLDEASQLIEQAEKRTNQSTDLPRLKRILDETMARVTELPPKQGDKDASVTPGDIEKLKWLDIALDIGEGIFTKSSEEINQWKAGGINRRTSRLFLDETKGHDPVLLAKALEELSPVESWARVNGHTDIQNDTLWEIYLCHSRLGAHSEAADALQTLRRNVEKRRSGIGNPLERGGAAAKFPHLYSALCRMLLKAGRVGELLGAIEAAKGRAVADLMAQRRRQIIDEAAFAEPASRIGELMSQNNAHYLSFFVDDENTIAVLIGKDGSPQASGLIPLGKEQIRDASRSADPSLWGAGELANLGGPSESIPDSLGPLVAWLKPLFESGLIEFGDHICYSPDEHLHQIPLAYVNFMGEPLVRRVSLSRTHGVRALSLILEREASRPGAFVGVEVPGHQDLEDRAMIEHLRAACQWLAQHLPGTTIRDEEATLEAVRGAELAGRVLHFATHGVFPQPKNPFEHSGLALAGAGGLPDKERLARGDADQELLTPKWAIESGLDLAGSHVTLQACVTGLALEGIGGDALGLDWALFQLGASSLLASHWFVSAELSAEFFLRFYHSWLKRGNSRAAAWRNTVLGMMEQEGDLATPYAWAAFSLSGDWR